jgi:hypothetical protein
VPSHLRWNGGQSARCIQIGSRCVPTARICSNVAYGATTDIVWLLLSTGRPNLHATALSSATVLQACACTLLDDNKLCLRIPVPPPSPLVPLLCLLENAAACTSSSKMLQRFPVTCCMRIRFFGLMHTYRTTGSTVFCLKMTIRNGVR